MTQQNIHPMAIVEPGAKIGNHVTISGNVQFVNHDGGVWVFREKEPDIDVFGPIVIGNNVFISNGTFIKDTDIPDNTIVFGRYPHLVLKNKPAAYFYSKSPFKIHKQRI